MEWLQKVCPHPKGSEIWVKETHYLMGYFEKVGKTATGKDKWKFIRTHGECRYFDNPPKTVKPYSYRLLAWYRRPAILMSKADSRIRLKVNDVKVMPLQNISADDAMREGISSVDGFMDEL